MGLLWNGASDWVRAGATPNSHALSRCLRSTHLTDYTTRVLALLPAALAAGPLEVAPNLMQQLGSVLAVEAPGGGLASPDTDALLKQLKALQEQVALLDRIQNIR